MSELAAAVTVVGLSLVVALVLGRVLLAGLLRAVFPRVRTFVRRLAGRRAPERLGTDRRREDERRR